MAKAKTTNDAAAAAQESVPVAGQKFKLDKKEFQYVIPKFQIISIGERTAAEAVSDDTKYEELGSKTINEYLVGIGSGVVAEA